MSSNEFWGSRQSSGRTVQVSKVRKSLQDSKNAVAHQTAVEQALQVQKKNLSVLRSH